jgi:glyoxylase-like metal-dependent hydrolase (beta-lactamase superfamily II)
MAKLTWQLITKKRTSATKGIPPGKEDLAWVGSTATLISGDRDAVLVDTFLFDRHSKELVDWLVASGKNLTTIYITHSHGDHFFGVKRVLDRFPSAKVVATADVVAGCQNQIDVFTSFWQPRFPGELPSELLAPETLEGARIVLEGEELNAVELGHTDTPHSTALHVPSIDLVVAGDAVYTDTHLYLAECDEAARGEWLEALDTVDRLNPEAVITGHGVLDPDSSPRHIDETRQYLNDFNAIAASTATAGALYEQMLALHPNRVNPGSLWGAARAAKPAPTAQR